MPIPVQCPACGLAYQAPDQFAGRKVKCKDCKADFTIPAMQTSPSVPVPAKVSASTAETSAARSKLRQTVSAVPAASESTARQSTKKPTAPRPIDPFALDGGDPFADEGGDDDLTDAPPRRQAPKRPKRRATAADIHRAGRIATWYCRLLMVFDLTTIVGNVGLLIYAIVTRDPPVRASIGANVIFFMFLMSLTGAAAIVATMMWVMRGSWAGRGLFILLGLPSPYLIYVAIDRNYSLLAMILICSRVGLHWMGMIMLTLFPGMKGYYRGEGSS